MRSVGLSYNVSRGDIVPSVAIIKPFITPISRRTFTSSSIALALAGLLAATAPGQTQGFPTKPIKILVGAAPGGLIDLFARTYATELQKRSGQPVLVENNSVATGTIGADQRNLERFFEKITTTKIV
jgi:hypothetical protein